MTAMEWLIVVCLVALALWIVAGVIDARAAAQEPQPIAQPVAAHTPLPPARRPNAVSWARVDEAPPGSGRHRGPGPTS